MILTSGERTCIILGACALIGGGVLLHSSRWGLGLSPDSVVYIGAARSLLAGYGFTLPAESALFSPITHYPPLYSSLLAVTGSVAADPLYGAIWLNVAAFSVNIYVSGFLLFATLGSWQLALLGSLFTFTAFPLVQAHTMLWSEALFIMLELLGILLLLRYLQKPEKRILLTTSVVAGLAVLCRYAGFALVASGLFAVLFLGARERATNSRTRWFLPVWRSYPWFSGAPATGTLAAISSIGRSRFTRSVWNRSLIFPRCWQVGSFFGLRLRLLG